MPRVLRGSVAFAPGRTVRDDAVDGGAGRRRHADTHRVIKGRRWRVSDPALDEELRQAFVNALMDARRAVKSALAADDDEALAAARRRVGDAKIALGERGPKWWQDMADHDIVARVEAARRALSSVDDPAADDADLRRRIHL